MDRDGMYPYDTLRDVMEIHRREIKGITERLSSTEDQLEWKEQELAQEQDDRAREEARILHEKNQFRDDAKKLRGVVDSLKLELANERAAHQTRKNEQTTDQPNEQDGQQ